MELAEMENETEAINDVFVLCVLPLSLSPGYHLLFLPCLSFLDIIAFLLVFVPFSLPHSLLLPLPHTVTPTHSHINTELSLAYRDSLLLWSKAFIWWLGLKNGHLLLPLINSACVCECVCYWICCLLGFFGKRIYRKCILCCRMSVFKCVLKRQIVKARKMKNSKGHVWLLKQWLSLEQMMDKILWHPSMNGLQTKIIISIFPGISF